jgi:hypothetical protein
VPLDRRADDECKLTHWEVPDTASAPASLYKGLLIDGCLGSPAIGLLRS